MTDRKITGLDALTGSGVDVDNDLLEIVDASETNPIRKNKRISAKELIANTSSFLPSGTGAIAIDLQSKIRQYPSTPQDRATAAPTQTDMQEWIDAIPTSLGGTDPGHGLLIQSGQKYTLIDALTTGNHRIAFRGNAGGMGSGSSSIYQSVLNKDFFDFTTGNSDVASFENFMLLGQGSGTGRGFVLGRTAQPWFDSRIWNLWLASIGGKCIDGVNIDGAHVLNTGFDSASTDAAYLQLCLNSLFGFNRYYGMTNTGITLLEGNGNQFFLSHFDASGAANDTSGAMYLNINGAGAKNARATQILGQMFRGNVNDIVGNGTGGDWFNNNGLDTLLITGCVSDRPSRRFLLLTDTHKSAVLGNLIVDPAIGGTYSAIDLAGDCDGVYVANNAVVSITGAGPGYEYPIKVAAGVALAVIGENNLETGAKGRYNVATGAHVRALPGCPDYERFMVKHFDDFTGSAIDTFRWGSAIGSNGAVVARALVAAGQASVNGAAVMTTGSDAGGTMALNGVQIHSGLNYRIDKGSVIFEAKVKMSAITNVAVFIGFTDQVAALQMPVNGSGVGDGFTTTAAQPVGFVFDTAMTTKNWWLVGNAVSTQQNSTFAPVADTYETFRIEVVANGAAVRFYRNHTLVGAQMSAPIASNTPLTPVIASFSRAAATRDITWDYILVESERGT